MTAALKLFYGGSFNPPHIGHARLAIEVSAQLQPQSFAFVPCKAWGDKTFYGVTDEQRVNMLARLLKQIQTATDVFQLELSDLNGSGPSFTVDALARFSAADPNSHIVWLLGMDSWATLTQWHQWQQLTQHGSLLVVNRPGYAAQIPPEQRSWAAPKTVPLSEFTHNGLIAFIETTPLHVSSSHIRQLVAHNLNAQFLLPDLVERYINELELYKKR